MRIKGLHRKLGDPAYLLGRDTVWGANEISRQAMELLLEAFRQIRKGASAGVDGQTAKEYSENLNENVKDLYLRLKENRYRAPSVKRVWIDKADGRQRPIGMPTCEDKIVQRAVAMLLEPIYEEDFYDFSYGYRRGRNPHQALKKLRETIKEEKCGWIIDADIKGFFDSMDHGVLREFIGRRIKDGGIKRLLGKWLNAGISEEGQIHYSDSGTPQGGSISPLLSNIYLHYALDEWFVEVVQPRLKGKSFLILFCDDFVIGCEYREDAERVMNVLPKRLSKYRLTVHPDKTRLVDFVKPKSDGDRKETFDFLGFTHYWGKSKSGYWVVKKKTRARKLIQKRKEINVWCKENRHVSVRVQHKYLCQVLRGHYNYFGVIGNYKSLASMRHWIMICWRKWLNRRGGKKSISWDKFKKILKTYSLPMPEIVHEI